MHILEFSAFKYKLKVLATFLCTFPYYSQGKNKNVEGCLSILSFKYDLISLYN